MSQLKRIVAALGGTLLDGGRQALIPGPGHSCKDRSVSLRQMEDGRILIHCFSPQDDWRDVKRLLEARRLLKGDSCFENSNQERLVTQPSFEDKIARARSIWRDSLPLARSIAERYAQSRAISYAHLCPSLRFHPRTTSLDDCIRRPALIAAISNGNGEIQGVHITLLSADGTAKAPVDTPRRIIGRLAQGAVRLAEPGASLIVAEGLETTLSASEAFSLPAWAALNAGELSRFDIPIGVRHLIIAADNDDAGRHAAETLLRACANSAVKADIRYPPDGFKDWNDWARRKA